MNKYTYSALINDYEFNNGVANEIRLAGLRRYRRFWRRTYLTLANNYILQTINTMWK